MIKKIILILVIGILTIQTFPTEWLNAIMNKSNRIEVVTTNNTDEDTDEDFFKNLKFKLIEVDIFDNHHKYFIYTKKVYLNYVDLVSFNYAGEVICPPPNYI